MEDHRSQKLTPATKVPLFRTPNPPRESNPEQSATCRLLQISDEDYAFDPVEINENTPKLVRHSSNNAEKVKVVPPRLADCRFSVADNSTKTQNQWRRASMRFLAGEEVCVMKRERILNLSNFLLIDNEHIPEVNQISYRPEAEENCNNSVRAKPPKNVVAFIRRRNLSYLKEQFNNQYEQKKIQNLERVSPKRVASPTRKLMLSCQLKRHEVDSGSHVFQRPENGSPEMRSQSPNIRNRRIANYIRYRIGGAKV